MTLDRRVKEDSNKAYVAKGGSLPEVPITGRGDAIPDSGCYVPLISIARLTNDEKRRIETSEFLSAKGVSDKPLPLLGEIVLSVDIEGSNIGTKQIRHLVHNSTTAPGYLLGHAALCALGVILDYGARTITCGDAVYDMPEPHVWAEEAPAYAAKVKHAEWDEPVTAYTLHNTKIAARSMHKVQVIFNTPGFGTGFKFLAHLEERSHKSGHLPANSVYETPDRYTATERGLNHFRAIFEATSHTAKNGREFSVGTITVVNQSNNDLVLPHDTRVGKVTGASDKKGMAHSFYLSKPLTEIPATQSLDPIRKRQRDAFEKAMAEELAQASTLPESRRTMDRREREIEDERACDTNWPFEFQITEAQKVARAKFVEKYEKYLESEKSVEAERRRRRETRALQLQIEEEIRQCKEFETWQESFARSAAHRNGKRLKRTLVAHAVPEKKGWSFEDRKAEYDAEEFGVPTKESLSHQALIAAIELCVQQVLADGGLPAEANEVRSVLYDIVLPMAYDPRNKGTKEALVEPVRYHLAAEGKPKFLPVRKYSPAG
jgi:hypothetical protein